MKLIRARAGNGHEHATGVPPHTWPTLAAQNPEFL